MAISVDCPDCGKRYKVSDSLAGKAGRCKACGGQFTIPGAVATVPELDPYAVLDEDKAPAKPAAADDESPSTPPSSGFKPLKAQSPRSQAVARGETDPIYKWGFGTIIFGVLGFVMPLLGIQFKGIGELPVEAQLIIFSLAILIGTGLLIGGKPADTLQRVAKYVWLTIMGFALLIVLVFVALAIMAGFQQAAQEDAAQKAKNLAQQPPAQAPPQAHNQPLPTPPPSGSPPQMPPPAPPVANMPQPPNEPAGERPPGIKPVLMGEPLFVVGKCQVTRRQGTPTYEVVFHVEYQVTGKFKPGTQFFAVGESGKSKSNIPIPPGDVMKGQVTWNSTMTNGDTGPFRVFLATVTFDAPAGKSWVQVSNVVRGIPLTGN